MASMTVHRAAVLTFVLGALLAGGTAGAGKSVLSCEGKAPGPQERPMLFKIELHQANTGEMTIIDEQRARTCKCAYALDSLFDLSTGRSPIVNVNLRKQGCADSCEADVVKHVSRTIRLAHSLIRHSNVRYAVPFQDSRIAPCDSFSIDLERLRKMEHERIDGLNISEGSKQRLKSIKEMQGGYTCDELKCE